MRAMSRRQVVAGALRAGIGVAAVGAVGCGGPETYNPRDGGSSEEGQAASPAADSPLAREREQETPQEGSGAGAGRSETARAREGTAPSATPTAASDAVDPLVWRQRYHWRALAGSGAEPSRSSALHIHAATPLSWSPFGFELAVFQPGTFLPLLYSQLVVMATGDERDAHRGEIEGDLATGWEVPEPTRLVFNLRGDVRWPDSEPLNGRALTASDVQISHDAYLSPAMQQAAAYGAVERVEADDREGTVTFHLREPASYLLAKMTDPRHVIGPPHYLDDPVAGMIEPGAPSREFTPQGTGPFQLEYASIAGWGATRNPDYFKRDESTGEQLPFLDRIRGGLLLSRNPSQIPFVPRSETWGDWVDGRFEAIELLTPSELMESEAMFADITAQVTAPTPGNGSEFTFKSTGSGPFADARVRQALSLAIDRRGLADRLHQGLAAPDCGHDWTHVADESSDTGFREWPWTPAELGDWHAFDVQGALALLSAAGYGPETRLMLGVDRGDWDPIFGGVNASAMEIAAEQWQSNIGEAVEVRVLTREISTDSDGLDLRTRSSRPHADAALLTSGRLRQYVADPDDLTYGRLHSLKNVLVRDARLDELCERQRGELDAGRRSEVLEEIRKRDIELGWRLTLVNPYGLAARRGGVFNVGATHIAHSFDLNPKQFERAWRSPPAS